MDWDKPLDYFEEKFNSKIWPSDDTSDSPFNTFICKKCGFSFDSRVFGGFSMGVDPYDEAKAMIKDHLKSEHGILLLRV